MKKGEPPPKGVKEMVVKLAGTNPKLTNKEIREAITRKFGEGVSLSDRTVIRYCMAAGLPTTVRSLPQKPQNQELEPQPTVKQFASEHRYERQVEILPKLCKYLHEVEGYSQLMIKRLILAGEKPDEYPERLQRAIIAAYNEFENGHLFLPDNFNQRVEAFFRMVYEVQEQFDFSKDPKTPAGPEGAKARKEAGRIAHHEIPALLKTIDDQASRIIDGEHSDHDVINQLNTQQKDPDPKLPLDLMNKEQEKHWENVENHLIALGQPCFEMEHEMQTFFRALDFKNEIIAQEMMSHIRDASLWQNVGSYNEKANKLASVRKELAEEITKTATRLAPLESDSHYQKQYVTWYFVTSVIDLSLGKVNQCVPEYDWDELNKVQTHWAMYISKGIKTATEHRELVEIYSQDERVKPLRETIAELADLKGQISARLRSAINEKEYKYSRCLKCPLVRSGHIPL